MKVHWQTLMFGMGLGQLTHYLSYIDMYICFWWASTNIWLLFHKLYWEDSVDVSCYSLVIELLSVCLNYSNKIKNLGNKSLKNGISIVKWGEGSPRASVQMVRAWKIMWPRETLGLPKAGSSKKMTMRTLRVQREPTSCVILEAERWRRP